jgi:hypothetical protein
MAEQVCEKCGTRNSPEATFCRQCDSFLKWEDEVSPKDGRAGSVPPRIALSSPDVVLEPDGTLQIRVLNKSEIVEGYRADLIEPPPWLSVESSEINLHPNADGQMSVTFSAATKPAVEAQRVTVRMRIRSTNDPQAFAETDVNVTVPKVGKLVTLQPRPNLLRITDTTTASFELVIDNEASNYEQTLELKGSDPEAAVTFEFSPSAAVVPAARSAVLTVRIQATAPEPGREISRQLTLRASNELGTAEASITVLHKTSPPIIDPPLGVELQPSLLRITDTSHGEIDVLIDNREGTRDRPVAFEGTDPELAIRFSFEHDEIAVKARSQKRVRARMEATGPEPGKEITRQYTITVSDGQVETEAQGTLVQSSSPRPITIAKIHLEPEQLKIHDRDSGRLNVQVENKHGSMPLQARLKGTDPEQVVQFRFVPPVVEIPAGKTAQSVVTIHAPAPASGQEVVRQIRIAAHDGDDAVEASGTVTQTTSTAPITTAKIKLDPEQVTARDITTRKLNVVVENHHRTRRLLVGLSASDPERAVQFIFSPGTLNIPPRQAAYAVLSVSAPPPPSGQQLTRRLTVSASDTDGSVEAEGAFVQSTSEAPIATARLWLEPRRIRGRRGTGRAAVVVDNARGALPLRVSLGGGDPEDIVRFSFHPATMVVNPGQTGVAHMTASAPRPDWGQQVVRPFRVAATDGRRSAEADGALVLTAPDLWPVIRFLLTLLGGLIAIFGAAQGPRIHARLPQPVSAELDLLVLSVCVVIALVIGMIFGLTSTTGKLSRVCAILLFVGALGYAGFLLSQGFDARPIVAVMVGAVVAYFGGLFVRR